MAVQQIKVGQLLTIPVTEDELILLGPFPQTANGAVRFTNVSGTSKFGIGGPVFSDTNAAPYTTAGTIVTLSVDLIKQQYDTTARVHCSGTGTWKVEW